MTIGIIKQIQFLPVMSITLFQLSTIDCLLIPISPVSLYSLFSCILAGFNYIFFSGLKPFTQNTQTILFLSSPLFSSLLLTLFLLRPNMLVTPAHKRNKTFVVV